MKVTSRSLFTVLFGLVTFLSVGANAASINVQFQGSQDSNTPALPPTAFAGVVPQSNYNVFAGTLAAGPTALNNNSGTPSGASMTTSDWNAVFQATSTVPAGTDEILNRGGVYSPPRAERSSEFASARQKLEVVTLARVTNFEGLFGVPFTEPNGRELWRLQLTQARMWERFRERQRERGLSISRAEDRSCSSQPGLSPRPALSLSLCSGRRRGAKIAPSSVFTSAYAVYQIATMKNIYRLLLLVIAQATQKELARQLKYLKVENEILRSKLPTRIEVTPKERQRLVKFANNLTAKLLKPLVSIVHPDTLLRWVREARKPAAIRQLRLFCRSVGCAVPDMECAVCCAP